MFYIFQDLGLIPFSSKKDNNTAKLFLKWLLLFILPFYHINSVRKQVVEKIEHAHHYSRNNPICDDSSMTGHGLYNGTGILVQPNVAPDRVKMQNLILRDYFQLNISDQDIIKPQTMDLFYSPSSKYFKKIKDRLSHEYCIGYHEEKPMMNWTAFISIILIFLEFCFSIKYRHNLQNQEEGRNIVHGWTGHVCQEIFGFNFKKCLENLLRFLSEIIRKVFTFCTLREFEFTEERSEKNKLKNNDAQVEAQPDGRTSLRSKVGLYVPVPDEDQMAKTKHYTKFIFRKLLCSGLTIEIISQVLDITYVFNLDEIAISMKDCQNYHMAKHLTKGPVFFNVFLFCTIMEFLIFWYGCNSGDVGRKYVKFYAMLYLPIPILNLLEYLFVERMGPVDGFWDNMLIATNNIINVLFILVILKSLIDEFMVSLQDGVLKVYEVIPLLAGLITLIVQISRLCVNIGVFPNAKPLIDLKEDFTCNQFNYKKALAFDNFILIDRVIIWGSFYCILLGIFSSITLLFNMEVREFTVFSIEIDSYYYPFYSKIMLFGGLDPLKAPIFKTRQGSTPSPACLTPKLSEITVMTVDIEPKETDSESSYLSCLTNGTIAGSKAEPTRQTSLLSEADSVTSNISFYRADTEAELLNCQSSYRQSESETYVYRSCRWIKEDQHIR